MSNNTYITGFYKPYLKIEAVECVGLKIISNFTKPTKGYYQMAYIINGKFEFLANNKSFIAEKGELIISNFNDSFIFRRISENATIMKIYFHDSLIKKHTDYDVLEFFRFLPCGYTFSPANFENILCNNLLNSLFIGLKHKYNEFYMTTKFFSILSEISLFYKTRVKEDKFDKKNIAVKVFEYVNNNFFMNITYKTLRDNFFICNSTINKIFKQTINRTFKEHLTTIRLEYANNIMKNEINELNLLKIAELSGFKTYSTFYREYTKKYGVSPKIVYNKNVKKWPLS